MNYITISAQRVAGALGAEIAGVDLSRPLSDEVIGEIRQALLDHQVIFFHDQHLTPEQHLAFGRRFGELQIHDFVEPAEEDQHILEVRKEPYETRNFGGGWHTHVSYLERPSLGSVLYAREIPAVGGDTMFASQYLASATMSAYPRVGWLMISSLDPASAFLSRRTFSLTTLATNGCSISR